ncbi:MAG: acyltransferase [Bryobacteraceae bacterium]|nr:acyltransferase [Bryobacteraceae bacterium]
MKRDLAIDYLRSGVTAAVVAHHAALAYNTFSRYDPDRYTRSTAPVVDPLRFAPLDYFVAWNDIFFMALMFFISGLFVAPAIARKGPGRFLVDRTKRLGIPFAAAVTLLMPLAYYPSWRLSNEAVQGGFLLRFFTTDGWPAGPPWFLWLLLAFCAVATLVAKLIPRLWRWLSWPTPSAWKLVLVCLAISLVATIPLRLFVSPYAWSSLGGPFAFQTTRLLLYFAWFLLGVSLGGENLARSLSANNLRPWPFWLLLGLTCFVAHWFLSGGAYLRGVPPWVGNVILTGVFSACCTFSSLGSVGMFRALVGLPHTWADSLSANAYGIYVIHYGFVIWMQFILLSTPFPPVTKFAVTFPVSLGASWFCTAMLRRTIARRVL